MGYIFNLLNNSKKMSYKVSFAKCYNSSITIYFSKEN